MRPWTNERVSWGSWKVEEGTWTDGNIDWGTWDGYGILSSHRLLVLYKYLYIFIISTVHNIIACFWCHTLHISYFDFVPQRSCILKGFSLFLEWSMSSDNQVSRWKPKSPPFSGGLKSPLKNFYDFDIFLCVQLCYTVRGYIKKLSPLTCLSPGPTVSDCDPSCVLLSSYNNSLYSCDY